MSSTPTLLLLAQLAAGIFALAMCRWAAIPGLGIMAAGVLVAASVWAAWRGRVSGKMNSLAWLCTLLVPFSHLVTKHSSLLFDEYYGVAAGLIAVAILSGI